MRIPFNDFKKHYRTHETEITEAIKRVLESGHYILGKEVAEFEKSFASYLGTKHAVGVANGLEALQISLIALGIGKGDEVITTPHSAVATALSIIAVGATPVFVDIDEFYHIDAQKIEAKISSKTKAIIPVHLYGQAADMDALLKIAQKHNLAIIEDCAQADGTTYTHTANKKVGAFGTFGCFSFYPTKNLGAVGDGGAIITNDDALAEKCRMIRNYGQKDRYRHEIYGMNSRLDEIQAAILSVNLKHLDRYNKRRQEIAALYHKELSNIPKLCLPTVRPLSNHIYHLFVIETEKRDALQTFLGKNGIDTLIHYPLPIHKQPCFKEHNGESYPLTEKGASRILSLPIHPHLDDSEVLFICEKIKKFYELQ